jgi:hypothetical protein
VYNEKMLKALEGKEVDETVTTLSDIKNMSKQQIKQGNSQHNNSGNNLHSINNHSNSSGNKRPALIHPNDSMPLKRWKSSSDASGEEGDGTMTIDEPTSTRTRFSIATEIDDSNENIMTSPLSDPDNSSSNNGRTLPPPPAIIIASSSNTRHPNGIVSEPLSHSSSVANKLNTTSLIHNHHKKPFSFKTIRFERIGTNEWKIKESIIFDISKFIESLFSISSLADFHLYLINEEHLTPSLQEGALKISSTPRVGTVSKNSSSSSSSFGIISLENELKKLHSIITSWQKPEIPQLQQFLNSYLQYYYDQLAPSSNIEDSPIAPSSELSLFQFWNQFDKSNNNSSSTTITSSATSTSTSVSSSSSSCFGCLAYEITNSMMLIIRSNNHLGISHDIWCKIYPNDFSHAMEELINNADDEDEINKNNNGKKGGSINSISFGNILTYFFPQLLLIEKKLKNLRNKSTASSQVTYDASDIFVKYYHSSRVSVVNDENNNGNDESNNNITLPSMNSLTAYQTIGTFTTPAKKIMSR